MGRESHRGEEREVVKPSWSHPAIPRAQYLVRCSPARVWNPPVISPEIKLQWDVSEREDLAQTL